MKINIEVDLTPEEARQFLGLPNVEKLQQQLIDNAEQYLKDAGESQYSELISTAMQPMLDYQQWLTRMMSGGASGSSKPDPSNDKGKSDK